jgi:hypothetical protein
MDINVKVTIDAAPAFMALLQGLLSAVPAPGTPTPAPVNKLKKAEKPAEKVADQMSAPAAETPAEQALEDFQKELDAAVVPSVTIEQIRAEIPGAKAKVGADKVKALLTKYGTANVTNLPLVNYDAFYNELKTLAA